MTTFDPAKLPPIGSRWKFSWRPDQVLTVTVLPWRTGVVLTSTNGDDVGVCGKDWAAWIDDGSIAKQTTCPHCNATEVQP